MRPSRKTPRSNSPSTRCLSPPSAQRVRAAHQRVGVGDLQAVLVVPCGTRNEEPSWMLGNVSCGPEPDRIDVVVERAD